MKIKVSKVSGRILDWMVAKAEGHISSVPWYPDPPLEDYGSGPFYDAPPTYSTDWSQGGPLYDAADCLMETIHPVGSHPEAVWCSGPTQEPEFVSNPHPCGEYGPTKLIAFCRWYVTSKLGDEIDVPKELL